LSEALHSAARNISKELTLYLKSNNLLQDRRWIVQLICWLESMMMGVCQRDSKTYRKRVKALGLSLVNGDLDLTESDDEVENDRILRNVLDDHTMKELRRVAAEHKTSVESLIKKAIATVIAPHNK
jgi:hypothetical protein